MREIKQFIEAVEDRLPINLTLSYMFALPEYQALKAKLADTQDNDGWRDKLVEASKYLAAQHYDSCEEFENSDIKTRDEYAEIAWDVFEEEVLEIVKIMGMEAYRIIEEPKQECICKNTKAGDLIEVNDMYNL